ncbi:MAG: FeoB-associated Cys-rich membrane protein [Treponema sp.]|nr:FeoB-associated Cys-rich membrane protein [Treponema sp.]MBD5438443.1 FeoB-associated Cys-rich membrane protein [Treponema sp.]MBD5440181.1 FeoB-associated Cys-rich membrane protein [Treponema sp.]
MLVNVIVGALILIYATFVIFRTIKKRRNAKKSGNAGCPFCSGGSCSGCEKSSS